MQNINLFSQNIPASRITDWSSPGSKQSFNFTQSVTLSSFGADTSGTIACDSAFQLAINALNGAGEIYITKGTYLFLQSIILPDSIIIQGETDTISHASLVKFKLSPGLDHGIKIIGSEVNTNYTLTYPLQQGATKIYVNQPQLFNVGDYLKLYPYDDTLLVNNSWAYNSTGQILEIIQKNGDSLVLKKPLRRSYLGNNLPTIYKLIPRHQVHINCIKIERIDTTTTQTANIYFYDAADCSINGIESNYCNFAHIDIRNSTKITVKNSYFRESFSYGSDGKGYGVIIQSTSGDCYVHQNNFEHLRHSMILQSGANGNVYAYNYSTNPYWTGVSLPANSSGDMVFHGNYVYMNLMEGNVVQNIVIDNSHGKNGPFNTFYRNRAELYGIFMNSSPASDQQNFIGNQVTNTTSFILGLYSLQGVNHFEYGNMIKGSVTPAGTAEPGDTTMFAYSFNSFYQNISSIPPIKNSNWNTTIPLIEAEYRNQTSNRKFICDDIYYPSTVNVDHSILNINEFIVYPNPVSDELNIESKNKKGTYSLEIINSIGQLVYQSIFIDKIKVQTSKLAPGVYLVKLYNDKSIEFIKIIKN